MTKFNIYQVNMERDTDRIAFINYEGLEKFQHSNQVNSTVYDKVYTGDLDCASLENIYEKFNVDHPKDYTGRSLSVSDVVEISESDKLKPGFYFVDSFGFKEISFDKTLCAEKKTPEAEKISVLLVQPDKYPRMIKIEENLKAMQEIVGGDIEEYMPFEDEVAIICNDEGKMAGLPLNRAIYIEQEVDMSYGDMREKFREIEKQRDSHLTGYIVYSEDSFEESYPIEARTYIVSSNNKAFQPNMGGYSIFGNSLDGTDQGVRLEQYMSSERGGNDGWKIERCYMKKREMIDVIAGDFFVCYAPFDSEKFQSLPDNLAKKYNEMFRNPERFFRTEDGIKAVPFKPVSKDLER